MCLYVFSTFSTNSLLRESVQALYVAYVVEDSQSLKCCHFYSAHILPVQEPQLEERNSPKPGILHLSKCYMRLMFIVHCFCSNKVA